MRRFQIKENKYHDKNFDDINVTNNTFELLFSSLNKFSHGISSHSIQKENLECVESQAERKERNRKAKLVTNTCLYLKKRLHEKHMLDDIACSMGTNRTKLAASFKEIIGQSVFEWLRERRMVKAKAMLLATDLSIQQVAFEVGFDNCANFSTAFKKHYGMSPRQQRSINMFIESFPKGITLNNGECNE